MFRLDKRANFHLLNEFMEAISDDGSRRKSKFIRGEGLLNKKATCLHTKEETNRGDDEVIYRLHARVLDTPFCVTALSSAGSISVLFIHEKRYPYQLGRGGVSGMTLVFISDIGLCSAGLHWPLVFNVFFFF